MAERKSGPVKPPVIDLEARDASREDSRAAAAKRTARARTARRSPRPSEDPAAPADAAEAGVPESPGAIPPEKPSPATGEAPGSEPARPVRSQTAKAAPAQSAPAQSAPAETPPPPPRPRPPARLAMPWSAISIATIAGAVLGAGLTYTAANWIALPVQAPPFADPGPSLAALTEQTAALDTRLGLVEGTARRTQVSLDATLVQLDGLETRVSQSLDELRAAIPEAQAPLDLGAIEEQLANLESRVTAIAAGASSDDAAALAQSLTNIEASLANVTAGLDAATARLSASDGTLETLRTELDEAKAAIAAQTRTLAGADVGPAVRLPLIVSGLEAAFATGRPYRAELDGLMLLLPDLSVPAPVADNAAAGLPRPDAILARFEERLPAILAGRTAESTGDWAQDAIEWAKALLALRPAEEMEGSTPEAIVSRLEGAMERRDFTAATALLAQLPAPMREASGEVGTDVVALATAETFVAGLRAEALAPAEPAN